MTRREFLEALAAGFAAGLPLAKAARAADLDDRLYTLPSPRGGVTLMHFTTAMRSCCQSISASRT